MYLLEKICDGACDVRASAGVLFAFVQAGSPGFRKYENPGGQQESDCC